MYLIGYIKGLKVFLNLYLIWDTKMVSKFTAFGWIKKVILSCVTFEQIGSPCDNLIENFSRDYGDTALYFYLLDTQNNREAEIHNSYAIEY